MRSTRTLALALICSSHVSLCTGSVLSIALVLLAHASSDPVLSRTPMTPALGGSVCLLETPFDGVTPKAEESPCADGKQCFTSSTLAIHKNDLLPTAPALELPLIASGIDFALPFKVSTVAAPHRPPGHTRLFAMSMVRRE